MGEVVAMASLYSACGPRGVGTDRISGPTLGLLCQQYIAVQSGRGGETGGTEKKRPSGLALVAHDCLGSVLGWGGVVALVIACLAFFF